MLNSNTLGESNKTPDKQLETELGKENLETPASGERNQGESLITKKGQYNEESEYNKESEYSEEEKEVDEKYEDKGYLDHKATFASRGIVNNFAKNKNIFLKNKILNKLLSDLYTLEEKEVDDILLSSKKGGRNSSPFQESIKKLSNEELEYYVKKVIYFTYTSGILKLNLEELDSLCLELSSRCYSKLPYKFPKMDPPEDTFEKRIITIESFIKELKRQYKSLESKVEIKTILTKGDIKKFEDDFKRYTSTNKCVIYIIGDKISKMKPTDTLVHIKTIYINFEKNSFCYRF